MPVGLGIPRYLFKMIHYSNNLKTPINDSIMMLTPFMSQDIVLPEIPKTTSRPRSLAPL